MSMAYGSARGALEDTTLDEPVSETLNRELRAIAKKLHKVAWMNSDSKVGLFLPVCLLAYPGCTYWRVCLHMRTRCHARAHSLRSCERRREIAREGV
jgi:hypothetical protein